MNMPGDYDYGPSEDQVLDWNEHNDHAGDSVPAPGSPGALQNAGLDAYTDARQAVLRIARKAGAPILTRPVWPGSAITMEYAAPAAGLRIARQMAAAAHRVIADYTRYARQDGLGWQEIGAALGVEAPSGQSVAEAAFEGAAGGYADSDGYRRFDRLYVSWTCPACGQAIADYGPYESHPSDNEAGHGDGCPRLAADTAAYLARQGGEDL